MNLIKHKKENELYLKYNKHIRAYFTKFSRMYDNHVLTELSNDVFMKLNDNIKNISNENNGIVKWIYTTCRNTRIDCDRKKMNEDKKKYLFRNEFLYTSTENSVEDIILSEEEINTKLKNFDDLSKDILKYKIKGYKNNEIMLLLNISERKLYRKLNELKHDCK